MTNCNNVIFSFVSYRRNINEMPFVSHLADFEQAVGITRAVGEIFEGEIVLQSLKNMSLHECYKKEEAGIITKEVIENKDISAFGTNDSGTNIVLVNEEDHIKLYAKKSGFSLDECFSEANRLDDILLEKLEMAFDVNLGYLTANPNKLGTGMEIGCMLFIPALVKSKKIEKIKTELLKNEFEFYSTNGEKYDKKSPFVIIKNIYTFGYKENQFAEMLYKIVQKILELEKTEENNFFNISASTLVDDIYRQFGVLCDAYRLTYSESEEMLGSILWGINLKVLKVKKKIDILNLLSNIKTYHLTSEDISIKEIEKLRAKRLNKDIRDFIYKGEVDV